jgi:uncharacterized membrane protein YkgB
MAVTLRPRIYFLIDRVSKLVGLIGIVAALMGLVGPFSLLLGLLGLAIGVSTVFIDTDLDFDEK